MPTKTRNITAPIQITYDKPNTKAIKQSYLVYALVDSEDGSPLVHQPTDPQPVTSAYLKGPYEIYGTFLVREAYPLEARFLGDTI